MLARRVLVTPRPRIARTTSVLDKLASFASDSLGQDSSRDPDLDRVSPDNWDSPFKVTVKPEASDTAIVTAEVTSILQLWLWETRHALTDLIVHLEKLDWTILQAPSQFRWMTSDDPAICLNYDSPDRYSFGGGWAREGCEIVFPLSPNTFSMLKLAKRGPGEAPQSRCR